MNPTEATAAGPDTVVWLVLIAIIVGGLVLAQVCSHATWMLMRDNAPGAARIGWGVSIVAALATITWYWYPEHMGKDAPQAFLIGEGIAILLVLLLFIFTVRRRPA